MRRASEAQAEYGWKKLIKEKLIEGCFRCIGKFRDFLYGRAQDGFNRNYNVLMC